MRLLIDRADVNPNSLALCAATARPYGESGCWEMASRFWRERRASNAWVCSDQTPLSFAAGSGHEGVVKLLLERGDVTPNLSDGDGRTPLSHAAGIWTWGRGEATAGARGYQSRLVG